MHRSLSLDARESNGKQLALFTYVYRPTYFPYHSPRWAPSAVRLLEGQVTEVSGPQCEGNPKCSPINVLLNAETSSISKSSDTVTDGCYCCL